MAEAGVLVLQRPERGPPGELSRHALGTPLLAIRGAAELLLSGAGGPLGGEARELVGAVGEAAQRLERLLGPLLEVAGRAGGPRRQGPLDLGAVLAAAGIRLAGPAAATLARADPSPLAAALGLARRLVGGPLEARLRPDRRGRLLLLELAASGEPERALAAAEEAGLLLGLLARLARLAGGRLTRPAPGRLGIVLRRAGGCGAAVTG
jgi:hypothetical protein